MVAMLSRPIPSHLFLPSGHGAQRIGSHSARRSLQVCHRPHRAQPSGEQSCPPLGHWYLLNVFRTASRARDAAFSCAAATGGGSGHRAAQPCCRLHRLPLTRRSPCPTSGTHLAARGSGRARVFNSAAAFPEFDSGPTPSDPSGRRCSPPAPLPMQWSFEWVLTRSRQLTGCCPGGRVGPWAAVWMSPGA